MSYFYISGVIFNLILLTILFSNEKVIEKIKKDLNHEMSIIGLNGIKLTGLLLCFISWGLLVIVMLMKLNKKK